MLFFTRSSKFICTIKSLVSTKKFSSKSLTQFNRMLSVNTENNKITSVYNNILKSNTDNREYRGLELKNGMKCLLISDSKTDKSAAALDVHIGFLKLINY